MTHYLPPLVCRCSYWASQLIIASIRYFYVKYPIQVHNFAPTNGFKNKMFLKLLRYVVCNVKCIYKCIYNPYNVPRLGLTVLVLLLVLQNSLERSLGTTDLFLQDCLQSSHTNTNVGGEVNIWWMYNMIT